MRYFQLLDMDCSSTLGTCCSDYGIAALLSIIRSFLDIMQIIVPIVLIVMVTIQFIQMMVSPDDKKSTKKLLNKFVAAVIFFFLPFIVNLMVNMMPETFSLSACWRSAKTTKETLDARESTYIVNSKKKAKSIYVSADKYELGDKVTNSATGSAKNLIDIALAEVGNNEGNNSHGKYEDFTGLDYSQPWCAAFVTWCAGQAGLLDSSTIPNYVGCSAGVSWFQSKGQFQVEGSGYTPQPGDIVFYGSGGGSHTGIVVSADENYVYTVEGNTSCEGGAANLCGGNDGVSEKTRARGTGYVYGYGTPAY